MTLAVADVVTDVARRIARPGARPDPDAARELIASVLELPTHWARVRGASDFTAEDRSAIDDACARLQAGMPVAYAARRAAFRTLTLRVDERVLIPRPETELLVEIALEMTGGGSGTAIDVGTGSGAIALALAVEGTFNRIVATDVSLAALDVARENEAAVRSVVRTGRDLAPIEWRHGTWLSPCTGERAGLVISNPPYIAHAEAVQLPASVRNWEPPIALFAGEEGLSAVGSVAAGAALILEAGGVLAIEVDSRRAGRAAAVVEATGAFGDINVKPDLSGRARFVVARRREA